MKKFQEKFPIRQRADAFVQGVQLALTINPNPNVIIRRPDVWTVEVIVTEPEKSQKCHHLSGYWIDKRRRSFRCYGCGHQFDEGDLSIDKRRNIEVWRK